MPLKHKTRVQNAEREAEYWRSVAEHLNVTYKRVAHENQVLRAQVREAQPDNVIHLALVGARPETNRCA